MKVMVICGQNSCRSQMAEGLLRYMSDGKLEVFSAGIIAGGVHPLAIEAMREIGIDISGQTSDQIDLKLLQSMDVVIAVCTEADKQCPVVLGAKKLYWPVPDPARAIGSDEEIMRAFRSARDKLREYVAAWIEDLGI